MLIIALILCQDNWAKFWLARLNQPKPTLGIFHLEKYNIDENSFVGTMLSLFRPMLDKNCIFALGI